MHIQQQQVLLIEPELLLRSTTKMREKPSGWNTCT
jgi:hypothetical protein